MRSVAFGCVVLCFVFCVFCSGFVVAVFGLGVRFLVLDLLFDVFVSDLVVFGFWVCVFRMLLCVCVWGVLF